MDFTYSIICYNQENYILEHLESIKYSINNYGKKYNNFLLIYDDNSTDNTHKLINEWVELNSDLFKKVDVYKNNENLGLNKNYLLAISNIRTEKFKLLAGDDIYGPSNIYNLFREDNPLMKYDLIFSPIYVFNDKVYKNHLSYGYRFVYNQSKKLFTEHLKKGNFIFAPGVFIFNRKIFTKEYYDLFEDYDGPEDYLSWYYFFIINNKRYYFSDKVFILYRSGYKEDQYKGHTNFQEINHYLFQKPNLSIERAPKKILILFEVFKIFVNPKTIFILFKYYIINHLNYKKCNIHLKSIKKNVEQYKRYQLDS